MVRVAILGAGINGLSCAVKIKEKYPNINVDLFSNEFTPDTTGDGCGGLWYPYICGDTPEKLLWKWGGETYKFIHKLWSEGGYDVALMPLFELYKDKIDLPVHEWAQAVFGYRILDKKHLEYLSSTSSNTYRSGRTFITFIIYPPTILRHLSERFKKAGGIILHCKIESLNDSKLDDYDIVISCLGLGALDVVPDKKVFPIRGQISRVSAPWINEIIFNEIGNYILPNVYDCVLGGTHQEHDFNTALDDSDTEFIIKGCKDMIPGIEHAKVNSQWVGLRPARDTVRLDYEDRNGKLYIYNYGHGGSGLTLFWGCASDVLDIFDKYVSRHEVVQKSKL